MNLPVLFDLFFADNILRERETLTVVKSRIRHSTKTSCIGFFWSDIWFCKLPLFCSPVPAGAPQNFTAIGISSTSVRLQWDPPATKHRNGEIVLYEILFHQRINPADDSPTNTTDTMLIVDGLEPSTDYIFQIRAYTSKGPGPWSNQLPYRTFGQRMSVT